MTRPGVSILMSVRNEERYLEAALISLRRQTYEEWELIAVDDGSDDGTAEILKRHAGEDKRIKPFIRQPACLVNALVFGTDRCQADVIARMDGDDICHPKRLAKQANFLHENQDISLVATKIRYFPTHVVQGGMRHYEQWQNSLTSHQLMMRDLFVESPVTQPSVMYRKNAVDQVGGYQDNSWGEDYDLWLRMALAGYRFARIPETLFFWREHKIRLTHLADEFSLDSFRRCKVHYLRESYLKGHDTVTLWGTGQEGKAWRKVLKAAGIRVVHWIDIDPNKIGQTIHQAAVTNPDSLRPGCGPMLITIGARGARPLVRKKCAEMGLTEGTDFVCVT